MNKSYLTNASTKKQFLKENPAYGFNSTSQRFSYMKEMQKMGEVPGPGSYIYDEQDQTTICASTKAPAPGAPPAMVKQGLNTISSTGGGAFFR